MDGGRWFYHDAVKPNRATRGRNEYVGGGFHLSLQRAAHAHNRLVSWLIESFRNGFLQYSLLLFISHRLFYFEERYARDHVM